MNKIAITIFLFSFLSFNSCNSDFNQSFDKLVNIKNGDCLYSVNMSGIEHISNTYKTIFLMGKEINSKLLEKALSEKQTKYRLCPMAFYLTEGDIAICLLLDINKIRDDEFKQLIPEHLVKEYESSGASPWWRWIQDDIENRKWVIDKIAVLVNQKLYKID